MTSPTERRREKQKKGWIEGKGERERERESASNGGRYSACVETRSGRGTENITEGREVMGEGVVHIQRREEHTSGRHERVREERREERRYDYQENSKK